MGPQTQQPLSVLRLKQVRERTGLGRSTVYDRIKQRTWPAPIHLGPRAVGWPAHEVDALIGAHIAGHTEAAIRELVAKLLACRAAASAA